MSTPSSSPEFPRAFRLRPLTLLAVAFCLVASGEDIAGRLRTISKIGKEASRIVNPTTIKAFGATLQAAYNLYFNGIGGTQNQTKKTCDEKPRNDGATESQLIVPLNWSNANFNGFANSKIQCVQGMHATHLRWKEQRGYGLVDLEMICSDGRTFQSSNNSQGLWDKVMSCAGEGFAAGQAEEMAGYGIVNFRTWCAGGGSEMVSNGDFAGVPNEKRACPSQTPAVIGVQVQEQPGYGLVNVRLICGEGTNKVPPERTELAQFNDDWRQQFEAVWGVSREEFTSSFKPKSVQKHANGYGDPEVCCVWSQATGQFEVIEVYGPFITVCLDRDGDVDAIEFVALCEGDGVRCQTDSSYYVAEVGRLEIPSYTFKYKDMRSTIGANNRHNFCEDEWSKVPAGQWQPSEEWLRPFSRGRSFFTWAEKPFAAIEAAEGAFVTGLFSQEGQDTMVALISNFSFTDEVAELNRHSLEVLAYSSGADPAMVQQRNELSQYVLITSMIMSHKGHANRGWRAGIGTLHSVLTAVSIGMCLPRPG